MISCGDSKETIARAIGCSKPTLELYFDEEIKNGWAKKRREILKWMEAGARKGNATLIKRLEEMTRLAGAAAEFERKAGEANETPAPQRARKQGKKEMQREAAFNAGLNSEWGEDLAPLPGTKPN